MLLCPKNGILNEMMLKPFSSKYSKYRQEWVKI